MLSRVKKNDTVCVLSGKDKGKQGLVIAVDQKNDRVLVKDVAVVTRHKKARKQGERSEVVKEESYIPLCKVMPVCPSCKQACRVRIRILEDAAKTRACHRCNDTF